MVLNFWGPALRHFVGSKSCPTQCRHHSSAGQEVFPKPSGHCPLQSKIQHRNLLSKNHGENRSVHNGGAPCLPECCCKPSFFYFLGIEIPNWNIFSQKFTRLPLVNTLKKTSSFWTQFYLNLEKQPKIDRESLWHLPCDPVAMTIWNAPPYNCRSTMHIFKSGSNKWRAWPCTTSWQFWGAFRSQFADFGNREWKCHWSYMWCTDNYTTRHRN